MNRHYKIAFFVLFILILSGCGKNSIMICSDSDETLVYKIYSTGKYINKMNIYQKFDSVDDGSTHMTLLTTYKMLNDVYGGYEYSVDVIDDKIISNLTINYDKMNIEKYIQDTGAKHHNNKILLDETVKSYKMDGLTCKKEMGF